MTFSITFALSKGISSECVQLGLVAFEIVGGLTNGEKILNALNLLSMAANLGDSPSIAMHLASATHSKLTEQERQSVGIISGLIRFSVGLEHKDDIE